MDPGIRGSNKAWITAEATGSSPPKMDFPPQQRMLRFGLSVELDGIANWNHRYVGGITSTLALSKSHQVLKWGSRKTTSLSQGSFSRYKGDSHCNQDFRSYSFRINLDHQIQCKVKIPGTSTLVSLQWAKWWKFQSKIGGALQEESTWKPFGWRRKSKFPFQPLMVSVPIPFGRDCPVSTARFNKKRYRNLHQLILPIGEIAKGLTLPFCIWAWFNIERNGRFTRFSELIQEEVDGCYGEALQKNRFNYTVEIFLTYN